MIIKPTIIYYHLNCYYSNRHHWFSNSEDVNFFYRMSLHDRLLNFLALQIPGGFPLAVWIQRRKPVAIILHHSVPIPLSTERVSLIRKMQRAGQRIRNRVAIIAVIDVIAPSFVQLVPWTIETIHQATVPGFQELWNYRDEFFSTTLHLES